MNVLIYASKDDTRHKHRGPLGPGDRAYWTVNGTPRKCEPNDNVFFHNGDMVYARGTITKVEEGKIWFKPLERFKAYAETPPTRGFTYLDGTPTPPCRACGNKATTKTTDKNGITYWCSQHAPPQ